MPLTLRFQTRAEFAGRLRARYRNSSRDATARIARRVLGWLADGEFTDTQIRNAFGLSVAQWTTLRGRMQTLVDQYNSVQVAQGE